MDPTTLRNALGFIRRQWWVVAQAMLVVGALTAFLATREADPPFQSTATVKVEANNATTGGLFRTTAESYLNGEQQLVRSTAVITATATASKIPEAEVRSSLTTGADTQNGYVFIGAKSTDRARAQAIANAASNAFIEFRQDRETKSLQTALKNADQNIVDVQRKIEELAKQLAAVGVPLTDAPADSSTTSPADGTATTVAAGLDVIAVRLSYDSYKEQLAAVIKERATLDSQISQKDPVASIISEAGPAFQPAKKSPLRQGALGAVIGMVLGAGIAVLRELLDDRVHTRHDVEKASGKPVIAELPYDSASASSRRNATVGLASIERPHEVLAEAIRQLRTSVSFLAVDQPINCLTITSAEPDEGKSLVAANLAVAFAQAGVRTILVSGDLRRPSLDARMLPADSRGFSDLIMSFIDIRSGGGVLAAAGLGMNGAPQVDVSEVMFNTQLPELRFVPVGTVPPNPAELLASKAAAHAIVALREQCDMLIIDSPPTLVTDGVILADLADATLVVTAMSQSHKSRISAAVDALSGGHVRVLGIVLNKVSVRSGGYQAYAPVHRRDGRSGPRGGTPKRPKGYDTVAMPGPVETYRSTTQSHDTAVVTHPPHSEPIVEHVFEQNAFEPIVYEPAVERPVVQPRAFEPIAFEQAPALVQPPLPRVAPPAASVPAPPDVQPPVVAPRVEPVVDLRVEPTVHEAAISDDTMQRPSEPPPARTETAPHTDITTHTTPQPPEMLPPPTRRPIPPPPVVRTIPVAPPPPPAPPGKGPSNGSNGSNGTNGTHTNGLNGSNGTRVPGAPAPGQAAGTEGRS